jgi:glutamine synthetase
MTKSKEDVLAQIDSAGVKYIRLWFTDILGRLKGMSITRSEIEEVLEMGQGFDGSSIEGFVRIEESDLMAVPDLDSFRVIPWEISGERVASIFCDVYDPNGSPYVGDPRHVLRRMIGRAAEQGYTFYCGPEIEYFYFRNGQSPHPIDQGGYFDYSTIDEGTRVRKKTVNALERLGVAVECSHHEVAPSQHEIDLKYQKALVMADFTMLYRLVVKEIAADNGLYATFMPKPLFGMNGSGMHTHMSLFKGERNAFFDPDDPYQLSPVARYFVAGLLKYVQEITLVLNQWVNSYKRLVVGYEAPVYLSWGRRNRSSLIRVPMYRVGKEKATRVELRSPDPSCNPYLAFALMLGAGLKGIEEKAELPPPVEKNIFEMQLNERNGYEALPSSLENAVAVFEKSALARDVLGDHIFESLIANKRVEWDRYRTAVTSYEWEKYLPVL